MDFATSKMREPEGFDILWSWPHHFRGLLYHVYTNIGTEEVVVKHQTKSSHCFHVCFGKLVSCSSYTSQSVADVK